MSYKCKQVVFHPLKTQCRPETMDQAQRAVIALHGFVLQLTAVTIVSCV